MNMTRHSKMKGHKKLFHTLGTGMGLDNDIQPNIKVSRVLKSKTDMKSIFLKISQKKHL